MMNDKTRVAPAAPAVDGGPSAQQEELRKQPGEQAEHLIENSDGRWVDCEFRIDGPDLMKLLRAACRASASSAAVGEKPAPRLIGWRTSDYLNETSDKAVAENWSVHHEMLPIFEGDPHTKLATPPQAQPAPVAVDEREARSIAKDLGWQSPRSGQDGGDAVQDKTRSQRMREAGFTARESLFGAGMLKPRFRDGGDGGDAGGELGTLTIASTPSGTRMLSTSFDWQGLPDGTHKLYTTPQPAAVSALQSARSGQAGQGVGEGKLAVYERLMPIISNCIKHQQINSASELIAQLDKDLDALAASKERQG